MHSPPSVSLSGVRSGATNAVEGNTTKRVDLVWSSTTRSDQPGFLGGQAYQKPEIRSPISHASLCTLNRRRMRRWRKYSALHTQNSSLLHLAEHRFERIKNYPN